MNRVLWQRKAVKQLRQIPKKAAATIRKSTRGLSQMPDCKNVTRLTSHRYGYRLRAGSYRVLFDWQTEIHIIEIQEVRKRDERTY